MPEDLRQLGTPIETKDGAQSKADAAEDSARNYTDSEVTDHENSTSDVHGVGESNVESESGAQSKADAAESSANDYTDSEVSSHEDSTSGVHGVGDSDVASTADVAEKADDPHDNDAHSETFAVDGDTQPPENHAADHSAGGDDAIEVVDLDATNGQESQVPMVQEDGTLAYEETADRSVEEIGQINRAYTYTFSGLFTGGGM